MIPLLLVLGCAGPDYTLGAVSDPALDPDDGVPVVEPATFRVEEVPFAGSALQVEVSHDGDLVRETFALGGSVVTPLVDFLFVVDDSDSMRGVLRRVRKGFRSLVGSGAFPSRSLIAVTSMIPTDDLDFGALHPSVPRMTGLSLHPGFLGLVSRERLEQFRLGAPAKRAARMPEPGCDAWFPPDAVNANGIPCLVAHTQSALFRYVSESGLNALRQLLLADVEGTLFRPGAAVNVVFVTDTQDPGYLPAEGSPARVAVDDLLARRPTFDELQGLVEATSAVSSFRLHAIAPEEPCSERWDGLDRVYQQVVEDAGGVFADVCTTVDYAPLIRRIARTGATMEAPVFGLSQVAAEVVSVRVEGRAVPYEVGSGGRSLELDTPWPTRPTTLEVVYAVD